MLPDDGPVGPKHVGVINFVLVSVKVLKCKYFRTKRTLVQIVGLIIYTVSVQLQICFVNEIINYFYKIINYFL